MERAADVEQPKPIGNYFLEDKPLKFIHTGCTLLNCVIGGGWPLGRISNIVGDRSTGKSMLAIEACSNFVNQYPEGRVFYREIEAAFDPAFAQALGMPLDKVDICDDLFTVEDLFEDIDKLLTDKENKISSGLYIVDSLDALSDRDELDRDIDKGSYGTGKAKQMSKMFRLITQRCHKSNIHLCFISQVRDKIGALFGDKTTRSGGRALDFYASIIIKLSQVETIYQTKNGVKRPIGVKIKARATKNKISLPFRECEFTITFGRGIDDLQASLDWLEEIKRLDVVDDKKPAAIVRAMDKLDDDMYFKELARINSQVKKIWIEIEEQFLPTPRKHQ